MKQLTLRQVCLFFIAFLPISKIFLMPSLVAFYSSSDCWISVLIVTIIDCLTILAIYLLTTKNEQTLEELLTTHFGDRVTKIIFFCYAIYFLIKSLLPIAEQKYYVDLTLYSSTPYPLTLIPFLFIAFYFCTKRLRILGRLADLCWLITILGFSIIISLSFSNADLSAILPIGINGIKNILKGSLSISNWYGDCVYFFFFIGEYKKEKNSAIKILLSYFLSGIVVVLCIVIFYGTFSDIAFREKFALTEISKYSTVINNIGRFDYIAIFLLLFSGTVSLVIPLFFSVKLFNKVFNIKKEWIMPLVINLSILVIYLISKNYLHTLEKNFTTTFSYMYILFGNIIPLLLLIIIRRKNAKKQLQS